MQHNRHLLNTQQPQFAKDTTVVWVVLVVLVEWEVWELGHTACMEMDP